MPEPLLSNVPKGQDISADTILDAFGEDDKLDKVDKIPVKVTDDKEDKDDKDDKDENEIDLSDDEVEEDKLDLKDDKDDIKIEAPPKKAELLKEFPKLFTKFPWFEQMMFRDREYSELFGTVDEAKEAVENLGTYQKFEQDLIGGNTEKMLLAVKEMKDSKAWDKIVDNYLPTLFKVDKEAYIDVVSNVGKHFIKQIYEAGKNGDDEDLKSLAAGLNKYLFGNNTLEPIKTRSKEEPKSNELEQERRSFNQERLVTAQNELGSKIENVLKTTIAEYIDPNGEMSPYVKKNAIRDCLTSLHETIGKDPAFVRSLNNLWETAFQDKFSQNSLGRIRATYLGRSKRELGTIIKRVRAEAQKEVRSSKKREDLEDKEDSSPRKPRGPINAGPPRQSSGKSEMRKGESVSDFFSRDD